MKLNKACKCKFSEEDIYKCANSSLEWYRRSGLNVVTVALWNFDFVAEANKKTMESYRKEMQKTNKALSGFDELNNLKQNEDENQGPQGLINIPELDPRIVKTLENMAGVLKDNWDWISKILEAFGLWLGVKAVAGWLTNISGLLGATGAGGLLGLFGVLSAIAAIGVISIKFKYDEPEIKATNERFDLGEKGSKNAIETENVEDIFSEISMAASEVGHMQDILTGYDFFGGMIAQATGKFKNYEDTIEATEDRIDELIDKLTKMRKEGKLNAKQEKYYQQLLKIREQRINKSGAVYSLKNVKNYAGLTSSNIEKDNAITSFTDGITNARKMYDDFQKYITEKPLVVTMNLNDVKTDEEFKQGLTNTIDWIEKRYGIKFPTNIKNPQDNVDAKTALNNAIKWIEQTYQVKIPTSITNPKKNEDAKTTLSNAVTWLEQKYGIKLPVTALKSDVKKSSSSKLSTSISQYVSWAEQKYGIKLPVELKTPDMKNFIDFINKSFGKFGIKIVDGWVTVGGLKIWKIPGLSIGTDKVLSEGLAYLHKGESVVPADVVSGGYTGGNNNETNDLLRQLIQTVDDKDFTTTISSDAIGRASVKYINDQKRIMGGSVI